MEAPLQDTLNRHWKDDKSRFGFKMLQKMGWSEEKGLGKDETGVVNAVKVSKKAEGLGLGMTMDSSGNSSWGSTASSFNDVLQLLQESYGPSSPKKKKSKAKSASIKVGVKYKKHSAARDLSTKTPTELKAIFGNAHVVSSESDEKSPVAKGKEDRKKKKKKSSK